MKTLSTTEFKSPMFGALVDIFYFTAVSAAIVLPTVYGLQFILNLVLTKFF